MCVFLFMIVNISTRFQRYCEYVKTVSKFADKNKTNEKTTAFITNRIRIYETRKAAQLCARATSVGST